MIRIFYTNGHTGEIRDATAREIERATPAEVMDPFNDGRLQDADGAPYADVAIFEIDDDGEIVRMVHRIGCLKLNKNTREPDYFELLKGVSEMFIETRFFDSGKTMARLHKCEPKIETSEGYDSYVDEVADLEEWIEDNLEIELDDITAFVLDLEGGKWVNITDFC